MLKLPSGPAVPILGLVRVVLIRLGGKASSGGLVETRNSILSTGEHGLARNPIPVLRLVGNKI
ncbi:MAG: hypothetical protein C0511_03560 [Hyphomicrobium sp.]|nr:hypothetical protein [Hyphomicrobium sp.]PPC83209.1 MAG: hypothetical protein CTY40_03020 [Hyphomicrobium sp.]